MSVESPQLVSTSNTEQRTLALPRGSVAVGTGKMRDGQPVLIVMLLTGVLIPLVRR